MKRILSVLLICVICLTAVGCSNGTKETKTPETEAQSDAEASGKVSAETSGAVGGESEEVGPNGLKAVAVGEPFQVDAKYGSYLITITGIEKTDWWERKHNNSFELRS